MRASLRLIGSVAIVLGAAAGAAAKADCHVRYDVGGMQTSQTDLEWPSSFSLDGSSIAVDGWCTVSGLRTRARGRPRAW